ncbi:DUF2207 domain-containing protein [uncultured Roseibium sp.]|uniref:DUF2207 domain-containing protein n=1 Tax=uncultured Roseibium sp. TaxID=1936171 RepID=UPI0026185FC6|nr:DUF2207 domain-containing protein [uncultured Roseibium sp.]
MKSLIATGLAWVGLLVAMASAGADERILNYVSDIEVAASGNLTVTETITVRAEGDQIKRGIFRDIPLTAKSAGGRSYRVGFKLLSVMQDGRSAAHFTKENGAGVRIYIGEESILLRPGTYTYTIQYETDRQIRFFSSHDELYWNVTGNEWAFPIDEASARVVLPEGVRATDWTGYTGFFGATGQDYSAQPGDNGHEIVFSTTAPLSPEEGLTVVVTMPVGSIAQPTGTRKLLQIAGDFRTELIGGAGVLLVWLYYLWAWLRAGRDPAKGVIFPRFKPPSGMSPALMRYVYKRGLGGGWVALSAACLNLAVKKRLRLDDSDGDMTISLISEGPEGRKPGEGLPKGEAALEKWLHRRDAPLALNERNGKSIQLLGSTFTSAIVSENHNVYFRNNGGYLFPGVLLSLLTIAGLFVFVPVAENEREFLIMLLFFSVFATAFAAVIGLLVLEGARLIWRLMLTFAILGVALLGASLLAGLVTGALGTMQAVPVVVALLISGNILFFSIIGAPTRQGRAMLDEIEGLRLYLTVAEKDRLNMSGVPDMSTVHFEALLPYAVALDVEKPWAEAFERWLSSAAGSATSASYNPHWYSGRTFDAHDISRSVGATASAMAGSFQSSLPAPSSSSSGSSGGSSGGGGGGGGGGGW